MKYLAIHGVQTEPSPTTDSLCRRPAPVESVWNAPNPLSLRFLAARSSRIDSFPRYNSIAARNCLWKRKAGGQVSVSR